MSIVGPRPALFNQDDLVALRTAKGVHQLTPGLTGWAQVNGRDELPIPVKVGFDEYYLKNRSLLRDLKIILLTVKKVIVPYRRTESGRGLAEKPRVTAENGSADPPRPWDRRLPSWQLSTGSSA